MSDRPRLGGHAEKIWTRLVARKCADRGAAYWLEARDIVRLDPPLNKDRFLAGRAALVPVGGAR